MSKRHAESRKQADVAGKALSLRDERGSGKTEGEADRI
jgi:hypothetical protein